MKHFLILYLSYLALPFLALLIYLSWRYRSELKKKKRWLVILIFFYLLTASFIYARFVERYLIVTQTTTIETGFESKLIVIADPHLGVYKGSSFLERVVEQINQQEDIDAVLIPGDFTYEPHQDLAELFAPLTKLKFPTYAVLGNHDSEQPGPRLREELQAALEAHGVIFLHNDSAKIPNTQLTVLGLGDRWAKEDRIDLIETFEGSDNLIVMAHNPDTTLSYKNNLADLTVSGHTHGGQIRLPWLYKKAIPCVGDFDQGEYSLPKGGKLFVTSGLGEVGLPMRLGIPPVIDIIKTK